MSLTAPWPYYGSKSRWAAEVWERLGRVDSYVEPFAGSLAILLASPHGAAPREVASDTNGHVANAWRAIRWAPDAVCEWAEWPSSHIDLMARQRWLMAWAREHLTTLQSDPDWYDPKAAGWWIWGMSNWVGAGFCAGYDKRPHIKNPPGGQGVQQMRDWGVGDPWVRAGLREHLHRLSERLREVVLVCRPWSAFTSSSYLGTGDRAAGIVLDPPYLTDQRSPLYDSDFDGTSDDAARSSLEWAVRMGDDPRMRIVYFCAADDFPVPARWTASTRPFKGCRGGRAPDMMMASPHCLRTSEEAQQSLAWG